MGGGGEGAVTHGDSTNGIEIDALVHFMHTHTHTAHTAGKLHENAGARCMHAVTKSTHFLIAIQWIPMERIKCAAMNEQARKSARMWRSRNETRPRKIHPANTHAHTPKVPNIKYVVVIG